MMDIKRRNILKFATSLPFTGFLSPESKAIESEYTAVREFDISKFDKALLPREHGQLTPLGETIIRRYPSREHCMQMAAFFNQNEGLLIIANDPSGAISDWEIRRGKLRIYFYTPPPDVLVLKVTPSVEAVAERYKEWAVNQTWIKNRTRNSTKLSFIAVASSSMEMERKHLQKISEQFASPFGVWFTIWRRYAYDHMLPDYRPKETAAFAALLTYLNELNAISIPHINGLLWDQNLPSFAQTAPKVALRTKTLNTTSYSSEQYYLRYACPFSTIWQDTIVNARNAIKDSKGRPTTGIYVDMVAATDPMICWSSDHGHKPGDPYAWQNGIRQLLSKMSGARMVEGCAEVYLDLIDYALMHLHTDKSDLVPLWDLVYGDIVNSVGWKIPMSVTPEQIQEVEMRSRNCKVGGLGSPWMTTEYEGYIFNREILKRNPNPPILKELN